MSQNHASDSVSAKVLIVGLCVVVTAVIVGVYKFVPSFDTAESDSVDDADEPQLRTAAQLELAARTREQPSRQQLKVVAFRLQLRKAQDDLDALTTAANNWKGKTKKLLDGEAGRRLAGSRTAVEDMVALLETKRLGEADLVALQSRLDILQTPVLAAAKENDLLYAPSRTFRNDVKKLRAEITAARQQYRDELAMLSGLEEQSRVLTPNAESLKEVVQRYQRDRIMARINTIREARKQVLQNTRGQLATAESAVIASEAKVKLLKLRVKQLEAEEEIKRLTDSTEVIPLRQKFEEEWPRWRQYMTPFIAEGVMQPYEDRYKMTKGRGPVSYSALKRSGRLQKTDYALKILSPVGFYITARNDRPLGDFPRYRPDSEDWKVNKKELRGIQQFLIRYGKVMVEKKLLAP